MYYLLAEHDKVLFDYHFLPPSEGAARLHCQSSVWTKAQFPGWDPKYCFDRDTEGLFLIVQSSSTISFELICRRLESPSADLATGDGELDPPLAVPLGGYSNSRRGVFLGVTDDGRKPLGRPHAHEVGAPRVDPGALFLHRNHRTFDRPPPHQVQTLICPGKNDTSGILTCKSPSRSTSFADKAARNSAMRANKF